MNRYGFLLPFLLPLLVVAGFLLGGLWNFTTLAFSYVGIPILDLVLGDNTQNPDAGDLNAMDRDGWYRGILYLCIPAHFALLLLGAWATVHAGLPWYALIGLVLSIGTVSGSIGITVAHELGHHVSRLDKFLSRALLCSVCYMHFYIEHNRGHHSHVGTPDDPATARSGENFFVFYPRSVVGQYVHAWRLENERLGKLGYSRWSWRNAMWWCAFWPVALSACLGVVFGWQAVCFFFAQSFIAFTLLELVNYVEHYGLERRRLPDGKFEKINLAHSWNASQSVSSYFLFNLTRHSHHHIQTQRHYQTLSHLEKSPQLPMGYAGMLLLALVPPLWRRVMDPRLMRYRGQLIPQDS